MKPPPRVRKEDTLPPPPVCRVKRQKYELLLLKTILELSELEKIVFIN